VVADPATSIAVIIDPVLDYDPATRTITTESADALLSLVKEKGYVVDRILETHAHADHLTAASYLQSRLAEEQGHRPAIGIGKRIGRVQKLFGQRYGVPADEYEGVFDKLFDDDEVFEIGELRATAMHLPGHTPDHLGYRIGDNVFCGDSVFHADIGSARCDFPGGSASSLFDSGRRLLALPGHVKIWTGHDYPPSDRGGPVAWMTVEDHRKRNKHLRDGISEDEFVALRKERDESLGAPRLLHQSLQMNIRAGRLPRPTAYGDRLLHLPFKVKDAEW
jgi:glyoxylase-like metal-dependent hydrolase (beta-lactamase superfamily II)